MLRIKCVAFALMLGAAACGDSSSGADSGTDQGTDVVISDGPAPDSPAPDGPTPDGPTPDGPTPDGPTPDGPSPDGPVSDGPAPDTLASVDLGPPQDFGAQGVTISGTVEDIDTQSVLAGVAVSLLDTPSVNTITDAQGNYSIKAPANQTVYVRFAQTGFVNTLRGVQTHAPASSSTVDMGLVPKAMLGQIETDTGYPAYDQSKGALSLIELLAGSSANISATHQGAFSNNQGTFVAGNVAISGSGFVAFWNVDVGTAVANFTVSGGGFCQVDVQDTNLRVVADHITVISTVCAIP